VFRPSKPSHRDGNRGRRDKGDASCRSGGWTGRIALVCVDIADKVALAACPVDRIALAEDARAVAAAAAAPHDHRLSQVVDRDRGVTLIADGGRVDLKFVADGLARGGVLPREDAPAAGVLPVARPGNQIIPVCVRRDTGELLIADGRRVDELLVSQSVAGRVEALGIDPPAAAILVVAPPRDDEVARAVEGHRGTLLVACGGAVDEELVTQAIA